MRRTTLTALAATTLLLAGCGSQSGDDGGSDGKVSPAPTTRSANPSAGACEDHAELKAGDDGRTVCVTKGGEVRLTLDGTKARPWKPVAASGTALKAINPGFVILPGDATAAYQAVSPGTVKLSSSRPLCAEPTAPGKVSCKGIEEWTVTVRVR
ncbi:hypothetical protein GCM10010503_09460 [Streptomyces lucensis JCM 4490]|uniref:Lipoprotein n=1 Tax=Streptomyces lucensis JCM 4490 TaxID=1306176 RepID=A0A918IWS5_9ACTN|nr:hypothetical protein [Streptomyces lucensis]GGW35799.1 hypothetical protein GCM10010503_09460 [Streptomyces lucensis JCM 4490]